jgi:hypothetical protein
MARSEFKPVYTSALRLPDLNWACLDPCALLRDDNAYLLLDPLRLKGDLHVDSLKSGFRAGAFTTTIATN